jgi:hypothetical protein
MRKNIIKGLIYFNGEMLLRAHFSGNFFTVDCTKFRRKRDIKALYSKDIAIKCLKNSFLTYNGKKYFEDGFSPMDTLQMVLLSDIEKIEFHDDETEFND